GESRKKGRAQRARSRHRVHRERHRMKRALAAMIVGAMMMGGVGTAVAQPAGHAATTTKVYDESLDARKQIADALTTAKKSGKRVLIQWGGNWCPWCIRLHQLMTTDEKIAAALMVGYEVVHVDAGKKEKNVDLAAQYKADVA